MHWILQNNIFNEDAYDTLIQCLGRLELPHSIHKVVPFVGELMPEPALATKNVICMGSYSMRHYAAKHGWTPGVYDLEPYDFNMQLQHWGARLLNYDSRVTTFKDARFNDDEDLLFIRPIQDSKVFAGKMFEHQEFTQWQRNVCVLELDYGDSLQPSTLIQLAQPKKIYAEYRCWVVGDEIVTMSMYKRGDRVIYVNMDGERDHAGRKFALDCLGQWRPAERALVIDVADTEHGWRIVEPNTINSCGFYAANIMKLVCALEDLNV